MHPFLTTYLDNYRKQRSFQVKEWVHNKAINLNEYLTNNNLSGCIVGCSGGVDSAVTFALCMYAQAQPNSPLKHVVPVLLPMNTIKTNTYPRAIELCNSFGVTPMINPIGLQSVRMKESFGNKFSQWLSIETKQKKYEPGNFAYGQLQSYLRTPHLYFTAQMMTECGFPSIVMGTGNMDEDGYLAYFCKAGDGVVDVQLISDLHKSEVFTVGSELGIPKSILEAAPTADLWDGQTDEEELGVSYDFVELFTGYYLKLLPDEKQKFIDSLPKNALTEFMENSSKCKTVHQKNKHKLNGVCNL
jgi:NAD+ synthase (glutamine-hydrolysing)